MRNNLDYEDLDLEALPADFIPRTSYQPNMGRNYDADYTHWKTPNGTVSAREFYRICWRRRAAVTGERTLITAVIPPGTAHVHAIESVGTLTFDEVLLYTGLLSSVVYDFVICSSGKADIFPSEITQLPRFVDGNAELKAAIIERAARLVCVTESYTALWEQVLRIPWSEDSPARKAVHRRSLLVELDVLAAMALNVTIDELLVLYRT